MNAATLAAVGWWAEDRQNSANWIENYQKSLAARHRVLISEIVGTLNAKTLLEVGCHCAPNLMRLAEDHAALICCGLDVNKQAIDAGIAWAKTRGVSARVKLAHAQFPPDTESLPTGEYDVVLSCYSLAYVSPADLDHAIYELGRLAKKAVIIADPMMLTPGPAKPTMMSSGYSEWRHDYLSALPWIGTLRGWQTRIVPVEPMIDRLNAILVVSKDGVLDGNTQ